MEHIIKPPGTRNERDTSKMKHCRRKRYRDQRSRKTIKPPDIHPMRRGHVSRHAKYSFAQNETTPGGSATRGT